MKRTHVFTSAAFNYIPKVRMLFRSLREHHPDWVMHLALADEPHPDIDLTTEPFDEVVPICELGIPSWKAWAFCHSIVELATAIKPFMMARLLSLPDTDKVFYIDPDIVVFSKLDDLVALLGRANIVLTPHQTMPESTLDAIADNEICSLQHGIYNLGFIGVSANSIGQEFAKWWGQRVYHFCRDDIPNGLFTDQRWIDLAPALFDGVAVMRSSRHNVATWNLTTRNFGHDTAKGYTVDGNPLGFYHFTGFDSGAHRLMAAKNAAGNEAVHDLIDWYTRETDKLADDPLAKVPWAYGFFSDGTPIDKAQRIVFRNRPDLQAHFDDPFEATGYLAWWNASGRVEYPRLFDEHTYKEELAYISSILTRGYCCNILEGSVVELPRYDGTSQYSPNQNYPTY